MPSTDARLLERRGGSPVHHHAGGDGPPRRGRRGGKPRRWRGSLSRARQAGGERCAVQGAVVDVGRRLRRRHPDLRGGPGALRPLPSGLASPRVPHFTSALSHRPERRGVLLRVLLGQSVFHCVNPTARASPLLPRPPCFSGLSPSSRCPHWHSSRLRLAGKPRSIFRSSCVPNSPRCPGSHGSRASTPTPTTRTQVSERVYSNKQKETLASSKHLAARGRAPPHFKTPRSTTGVGAPTVDNLSHPDRCHNPPAAAPPMATARSQPAHDASATSMDSTGPGAGKAAIYERFVADAAMNRGEPAATAPPSSGGVSAERGTAVGSDREARGGAEERFRRGWTNYTESGEETTRPGVLARKLPGHLTKGCKPSLCTRRYRSIRSYLYWLVQRSRFEPLHKFTPSFILRTLELRLRRHY